jgi:hypothetical protein
MAARCDGLLRAIRVDFKTVSLPENLKHLFSERTLNQLCDSVGGLFGASLKPQIGLAPIFETNG